MTRFMCDHRFSIICNTYIPLIEAILWRHHGNFFSTYDIGLLIITSVDGNKDMTYLWIYFYSPLGYCVRLYWNWREWLVNYLSIARTNITTDLNIPETRLVFVGPMTGEFPAQVAGYAENVSIWWRHHASGCPQTSRHSTLVDKTRCSVSIHWYQWRTRFLSTSVTDVMCISVGVYSYCSYQTRIQLV